MKQQAPIFCLFDQDGTKHCLADYQGKWILIYFYPKDDTPGCTIEACTLRDSWSDFAKHNAVVLGISADSSESHKKFETKYELPFLLLSDPKKEIIKKYHVLKEKSRFGKTFLGISRESFLINPQGEITKHYQNVKPATHAREVLQDLKELSRNNKEVKFS